MTVVDGTGILAMSTDILSLYHHTKTSPTGLPGPESSSGILLQIATATKAILEFVSRVQTHGAHDTLSLKSIRIELQRAYHILSTTPSLPSHLHSENVDGQQNGTLLSLELYTQVLEKIDSAVQPLLGQDNPSHNLSLRRVTFMILNKYRSSLDICNAELKSIVTTLHMTLYASILSYSYLGHPNDLSRLKSSPPPIKKEHSSSKLTPSEILVDLIKTRTQWLINENKLESKNGLAEPQTSEADKPLIEPAFLGWLASFDYEARHKELQTSEVTDAVKWILSNANFVTWLGVESPEATRSASPTLFRSVGRRNVLWCHGDPGAGKSVLM
jgi:hypothetical protein